MGLATIIRKHHRKNRQLRFLILGLDNAGKSTLISRWIQDNKHESLSINDAQSTTPIAPTFGLSIHTLIHQSSSTDASDTINIALWDIGGQASLRSFWRTYYSPLVHCLIFVIDLSDVHRVREGVQWLYRMYQEVNECHGGEDVRTITKMVVIGNKSDLCTSSSTLDNNVNVIKTTIEETFKGGIPFMTCSAKTGNNVKECLEGVLRMIGSVSKK